MISHPDYIPTATATVHRDISSPAGLQSWKDTRS